MIGVVYDRMIAVDTSAVIALLNPRDQFHGPAKRFLESSAGARWFALNTTAHEVFTRLRYDEGLQEAFAGYDLVRSEPFQVLKFGADDELSARQILEKYADHTLSFHDALCGAVMLREGIFKVFSFDRHFWVLGFEVVPGVTAL